MAGTLRGLVRRRRDPLAPDARQVLPPTADEVLVGGWAQRQRVLDSCDRSPALLRLTLAGENVAVLFAGTVEVGQLDPDSAAAFRPLVRRTERRGEQLWAHGQVERRGVELCVVLHCGPLTRGGGLFRRKRQV